MVWAIRKLWLLPNPIVSYLLQSVKPATNGMLTICLCISEACNFKIPSCLSSIHTVKLSFSQTQANPFLQRDRFWMHFPRYTQTPAWSPSDVLKPGDWGDRFSNLEIAWAEVFWGLWHKPRFKWDLSGREQGEIMHTMATGSKETPSRTPSAFLLPRGWEFTR